MECIHTNNQKGWGLDLLNTQDYKLSASHGLFLSSSKVHDVKGFLPCESRVTVKKDTAIPGDCELVVYGITDL